jgi:hypothetical protein
MQTKMCKSRAGNLGEEQDLRNGLEEVRDVRGIQ